MIRPLPYFCAAISGDALIMVLIVVVVLGLGLLGLAMSIKRRKDLAAWAQSRGLRFDSARRRDTDARFPDFSCLHEGSNRYAYNIMEGDWDGRRMEAFDYHYETHSRDSKGRRQTHHHHFSAVVLHSPLPLRALWIRPESFLDKISEFFGFDDIDFESAEFSRTFHVKAEDRRWAYDVLHPRAMQFLLDSPRFSIQFAPGAVLVWRGSVFPVGDFGPAADVARGLLEQMPEYLVRQQRGEG